MLYSPVEGTSFIILMVTLGVRESHDRDLVWTV